MAITRHRFACANRLVLANIRAIAASSLLILSLPAAAELPLYRALDVGSFSNSAVVFPTGLNSSGGVVGSTQLSSRIGRAYVWSAENGIHKIHVSEPGTDPLITALDINDRGQILGASNNGGPSGTGGIVIREVDGSLNYFVQGTWVTERPDSIVQLTNAGRVLGQSESDDGSVYPWIWSEESGLKALVDSGVYGLHAYQMNDSGRVVGSVWSCSLFSVTAVVYEVATRTLRYLDPDGAGSCGASYATAVNDQGYVVGNNDLGPFIWTEASGWKPLQGSVAPHRSALWASDINKRGQVVGRFKLDNQDWRRSFFYWDKDNRFHDLKKLLDPADPMTAKVILHSSGTTLETPLIPKINDRGEILVTGSLRGEDRIFNGPRHTFLLVPVRKAK
jgi:hypothetical protein